jgi:predicted nucleic acid-binding protein
MIVVSDTSPLNYLVLIHADRVVPATLGTVITPPAVIEELRDRGAAEEVRRWAASPPSWLQIQAPARIDPSLHLGKDEAAALSLALEVRTKSQNVQVLIDERDARAVARRLGFPVLGTLTVLLEAGKLGLIDIRSAINQLKATNFRARPEMFEEVIRLCTPRSDT